MSKFFVTTAIPYVNGRPHIGHAFEYFIADTIRRHRGLLNDETLLLSGADENALKNVQAAEKENVPVQEFLNNNSQNFKDAFKKLGVHLDVFQRGSDKKNHWPGVQELWKRCHDRGDIYKKSYTGLYCVGCESFKTEKELIDGLCPDHQKAPEKITEENYFFKLSNYQNTLISLIESDKFKITPENKKSETLGFLKQGLEDFSISRSKDRAQGVGVPIVNDSHQVMYVWFDALSIYMTGVGYGTDQNLWEKWWPADLHIIGKDISRFHTVYWPAMLLSAHLPLPREILIHGFIESGGKKMSKSLGNVINPFDMVDKYGLEPFRYFLLSQIPIDSDGDFTEKRFKEVYNADLANGLGNLIARVAKLAEMNGVTIEPAKKDIDISVNDLLTQYKFNEALFYIWNEIKEVDKKINQEKPWLLDRKKAKKVLTALVNDILSIAYNLQPFLPQISEKILSQFSGKIKSSEALFPRLI